MLSHIGVLALYRATADARHATLTTGPQSRAATDAFEQLLATIDSLADDQGGRRARRPNLAEPRRIAQAV